MIGQQCLTEQKEQGYQPVYEKNILTEKNSALPAIPYGFISTGTGNERIEKRG